MKKTILLILAAWSIHSFGQQRSPKFVMSDVYGMYVIDHFHEYEKKGDTNFKYILYVDYANDADPNGKYFSTDDPVRAKFLNNVQDYLEKNVTVPADFQSFGGRCPQYRIIIDSTGHVISLDWQDVYRPAKSKEALDSVDHQVLAKLRGFKFTVPQHPTDKQYYYEFHDVINICK